MDWGKVVGIALLMVALLIAVHTVYLAVYELFFSEVSVNPSWFSVTKRTRVIASGAEVELTVSKPLPEMTARAGKVRITIRGLAFPLIEVRLSNDSILLSNASDTVIPLSDESAIQSLRVRGVARGREVALLVEAYTWSRGSPATLTYAVPVVDQRDIDREVYSAVISLLAFAVVVVGCAYARERRRGERESESRRVRV
jgi:hypothetical protein